MGARIDTKVRGGIPLLRAYTRIAHVVIGKDREFTQTLAAQRDRCLDMIDAINADPKLQPLAEGEELPKGAKNLESENARRAVVRAEFLGPLEKDRDRLNERLEAHPNGAIFWVVDLHVVAPDGTKADVPTLDKVKFREVRYLSGNEAWSIAYRNDPNAPETVVSVTGIDQIKHAYVLLESLPEFAALNPARDDG